MSEQATGPDTAADTEQNQYENLNAFAGEQEYIPNGEQQKQEGASDFAFDAGFINDLSLELFNGLEESRGGHWHKEPAMVKVWSHSLSEVIEESKPGFKVSAKGVLIATSLLMFIPSLAVEYALYKKHREGGATTEAATDGD